MPLQKFATCLRIICPAAVGFARPATVALAGDSAWATDRHPESSSCISASSNSPRIIPCITAAACRFPPSTTWMQARHPSNTAVSGPSPLAFVQGQARRTACASQEVQQLHINQLFSCSGLCKQLWDCPFLCSCYLFDVVSLKHAVVLAAI